MKKLGMTLSEIMITVAIIGIIAAIILPMANNAKPNETKVLLLKNYDELTLAVKEMVNNSRIFWLLCDATGCNNRFPLFNTEAFIENDVTLFQAGNQKICEVLAFQYDVGENCSNDALPNAGIIGRDPFNNSFTTKSGADYRVRTRKTDDPKNFLSEILIDVNGNGNGNDCMYADACQEPDTFRFWVTADGDIIPGDRAAEYYIRTRQNLKSKHLDIRNNNAIASPNGTVTFD